MDDKIIIQPNKELGFNFPFILVIPKELNEDPSLVFACNLTRNFSHSSSSYDEVIKKTCEDLGSIDPMQKHLSLKNGNILFIPCIPRMKDFRPNFFGRDIYFSKLEKAYTEAERDENCFIKEDIDRYIGLKEQYVKMIKYAINVLLKEKNIKVDEKIIISGYSEGAKFASHFAIANPEIVKAVVAGGTGGCISMPISSINNQKLNYPLGISDIEKDFNMDEFKNIKFFYYIGKNDLSDSAMPYFRLIHFIDDGKDQIVRDECGNITPFIRDYDENSKIIYLRKDLDNGNVDTESVIIKNDDLKKYVFYKDEKGELNPLFDEKGNQLKQMILVDENGNFKAAHSLFNDEEVNIINKELGLRTQDRFIKQEEIYKSMGLDCEFIEYAEKNHRTIFDDCDKLFSDIDNFLGITKEKLK